VTIPLEPAGEDAPIGLLDLCKVFALIGVSSFGGGLSGWMYRELVERRGWISPQEFLTGHALARTLPGVNVVNLSIWIGYRLRGSSGAVIAVMSVLAAPLVIVLALGAGYSLWGHAPLAHRLLLGIAAASLGISLSMGLKGFRTVVRSPVYAAVVLATFIGVGVLRWPMLPIVGVLTPLSLFWATVMEPRRET